MSMPAYVLQSVVRKTNAFQGIWTIIERQLFCRQNLGRYDY